MDEYNVFVENFNLINCYVDTSYYSLQQGMILTSKFSNDEEQIRHIDIDFVVVANNGFKLNNDFSFDILFMDEWVTITNNDFTELTANLSLELYLNEEDFQLNGIDINNSLVYTLENGPNKTYIFLLGGFNDYKLVFRKYSISKYYYQGTFGDEKLKLNSFVEAKYNDYGELEGYESIINNLNFSANNVNFEPEFKNSFFTTYYVDDKILSEIKQMGAIPEELIINTYSYPIKFNDEQLIESTIKTGYVSSEINGKIFKNNYTTLDVFKFTVPDVSGVNECYLKIPFNNDISLDYEDIKGKTIRGYITYEVLTNTTTLFITDDEKTIYKNIISLGIEIPYKPNGELKSYKETQTRLAYETPKLYIKGVGKSIKGNYLKGFINIPNNILKDELDLLNNILNEGVFISDENN